MLTAMVQSTNWRRWKERPWASPSPVSKPGVDLFTSGQKYLLLTAFVLLIVLRIPQVWLDGRFFAEEGTIFFAYAWHRPAAEALWRPFAGYLNLAANASTLLAATLVRRDLLSLEHAPYVTMVIAAVVQAMPGVLILTGRAPWLERRWAVAAALAIIAISPMTEEVFVCALHVQFHLALCVGLIIALDVPRTRRGRLLYLVPLALAPLCGPGAIILLPVLVLRLIADKDRGRALQVAALGAGSAVQLLVFYSSSPLRGTLLDPATLANVLFVRLVVQPFFSAPIAEIYGKGALAAFAGGGAVWWAMTALSLLVLCGMVFVSLRWGRERATHWLILSALWMSMIVFGAGMLSVEPTDWFKVGALQRYQFVPMVLMGMALIGLIQCASVAHRRRLGALLGLTLWSGALTYFFPISDVRNGPRWDQQVAQWRKDSGYLLRGWTAAWPVDLSDTNRPCSNARGATAAALEPTYCESRWARFVASGNDPAGWELSSRDARLVSPPVR